MENENLPLVIAVCGTSRSGSSCIAGMLHKLGVPMGRDNWRPNKKNPKGFFEARGLVLLKRQSYHLPTLREKNTFAQRVKRLRQWLLSRRRDGSVIGGKQVFLCVVIPEMIQAWPRLKVIVPDRPVPDVVASMHRVGFWKKLSVADATNGVQRIVDRRDADLARLILPTLRLPYADLLRDPAATVAAIAEFCGITPTPAQLAAAIAHVDPNLNHCTTTA